ncbi:hypothetical protein BST86_09535 [Nonlabens agnitus]|uniref:Uncharacterized protein n=2 Tax=Nonlabens agnitus TaxID=870484 RepID=A0A2S9WV34_9FLAO|nr:hypothetical protein BST86_09535 [Nonlabens agnitus]
MYIPVTQNGEPFYQEGFVVRFYKKDGTDWVANFQPGWSNLNEVYDFPEKNIVVVLSGGLGYVMNPEFSKPLLTFGLDITDVFQTENGSLICVDSTAVQILDNKSGEIWKSERISWDGFKDLLFQNEVLSGLSFDPTNPNRQWEKFSLNVTNRKLTGGSFREFLKLNGDLEMKNQLEIQERTIQNKPWWKFWK